MFIVITYWTDFPEFCHIQNWTDFGLILKVPHEIVKIPCIQILFKSFMKYIGKFRKIINRKICISVLIRGKTTLWCWWTSLCMHARTHKLVFCECDFCCLLPLNIDNFPVIKTSWKWLSGQACLFLLAKYNLPFCVNLVLLDSWDIYSFLMPQQARAPHCTNVYLNV